jgi:hypothetical protein
MAAPHSIITASHSITLLRYRHSPPKGVSSSSTPDANKKRKRVKEEGEGSPADPTYFVYPAEVAEFS